MQSERRDCALVLTSGPRGRLFTDQAQGGRGALADDVRDGLVVFVGGADDPGLAVIADGEQPGQSERARAGAHAPVAIDFDMPGPRHGAPVLTISVVMRRVLKCIGSYSTPPTSSAVSPNRRSNSSIDMPS